MSTNALQQLIQREVYRIVLLQLVSVIMIAFIATGIEGVNSGISFLLGGLAYCLPSFVFVWHVFRYVGAQQMTQFVVAFFAGEAIKLILSSLLFLFIVKYLPVSLLSVLIGFIGAIISFWIICLVQFSKPSKARKGVGL
jgi:ATP synthase protein I